MVPGRAMVGSGYGWWSQDFQSYSTASSLTDPNSRTRGDTWAIYFTASEEKYDGVSGEVPTYDYKAVHLHGYNLAPGVTYYAFATKALWDPTSTTGWDTQNGEATALQSTHGGGYITAVAGADGVVSMLVFGHRLVMGGITYAWYQLEAVLRAVVAQHRLPFTGISLFSIGII